MVDDIYPGRLKACAGRSGRRGYCELFDDESKASGMPGKKITDHQVHKYKQHRNTLTQVAAAARAGISERSARRIDDIDALPSQRSARSWRTREDPLTEVWDAEVVPLLKTDALLNAVTLLEELQRRHPGQYDTTVLRTLQRRMRQWRAVHGAERDVYFAQEHPPGRLGLSDFTVCDELGIEVAGVAFPHRLYQFALAHSGWRHAEICVGGESFLALSSGLQGALWRLGGVPEEHRIDSLSAAFNNRILATRRPSLARPGDMRPCASTDGTARHILYISTVSVVAMVYPTRPIASVADVCIARRAPRTGCVIQFASCLELESLHGEIQKNNRPPGPLLRA